MGWHKYRDLFRKNGADERHFILGVDLGAQTSSLAYFNPLSRAPEVIDMSGGYGKPNVPTAAQYIAETDEWVFGEYAALNSGAGGLLEGFASKLGKNAVFNVAGKKTPSTDVLARYIKDLTGACGNLNPKAEIAGLTICVPGYMDEAGKRDLIDAFERAGLGELVMLIAPDRECALARYYYGREVNKELVLLLDFGSREARGGVYEITPSSGESVGVKALSSVFDAGVGAKLIDDAAAIRFAEHYEEVTGKPASEQAANLHAFAYQHKDLLFSRNKSGKNSKAYYNFAYPPFALEITPAHTEDLLRPYKAQFSVFLQDVLRRVEESGRSVSKRDIAAVVCAGGGFEMPWAREAVTKAFPYCKVEFYKNSKGALAEGAAILAAGELGVIKRRVFNVADDHQLKSDFGVITTFNDEREFLPLIKKNAFWWQKFEPTLLTVNETTDKPLTVELSKRSGKDVETIGVLTLDELPLRPAGTTRLKFSFKFLGSDKLRVSVKDYGFGDFYPAVDYKRELIVNV